VRDEIVGNAGTTQKAVGDLSTGLVDRIDADGGWARVLQCFQPFRGAEIDFSE
jgi:hypothetical protein